MNLDDNPTLHAIGLFLAELAAYLGEVDAQANEAARAVGAPSMYGEGLSPKCCMANLQTAGHWLRNARNADVIRRVDDAKPSEVWEMHDVPVDEECEVTT